MPSFLTNKCVARSRELQIKKNHLSTFQAAIGSGMGAHWHFGFHTPLLATATSHSECLAQVTIPRVVCPRTFIWRCLPPLHTSHGCNEWMCRCAWYGGVVHGRGEVAGEGVGIWLWGGGGGGCGAEELQPSPPSSTCKPHGALFTSK